MNKSQDLIYLHFCLSCMVLQKQLYINDKKMLATRPNLFTYLIDVSIWFVIQHITFSFGCFPTHIPFQ